MEPVRDVPIDAASLRVAIAAAEDGIDAALDINDMTEVAELAEWRRQLLVALRVFETD